MDPDSNRIDEEANPENWQSVTTSNSEVADYFWQLSTTSLHFLAATNSDDKFVSNDSNPTSSSTLLSNVQTKPVTRQNNRVLNDNSTNLSTTINKRKSRNPKPKVEIDNEEKEKKSRKKTVEMRIITAYDGSTLYGCTECETSFEDKESLELHIKTHSTERRFICDICGAGLKRKDHLTRHKQSHNPERPFVCSICQKAFKRKEQLTLHFVIHSGEKRHICNECNKGFYRKDHLRKHIKSHIARRLKAELSQQVNDI